MSGTLIARALERLEHSIRRSASYETCNVLGRDLQLRTGTFRKIPDYDDAWILACAQHATHVFDVGSNVGYDAILLLAGAPIERIALIEPNPEALAIAADNLIRNHFSARANFVAAFASDSARERVTLWTTGTGAAGSMYKSHAVTAAAQGDSMEVPTTTVDTLCDLLAFSPDLVKVDVEGAEAEVLVGSKGLAAKQKSRFVVEMHSNPDLSMTTNAQLILDWCSRSGYTAWYLKEHARLDAPTQIADRKRCHLLLQPAIWDYPEWLRGIEQAASLDCVQRLPNR